MIDTHSHINMIEGTPIESVIQNAIENGVNKIIVHQRTQKTLMTL